MINKYPYTNYQDMNLDWVLRKVRDLEYITKPFSDISETVLDAAIKQQTLYAANGVTDFAIKINATGTSGDITITIGSASVKFSGAYVVNKQFTIYGKVCDNDLLITIYDYSGSAEMCELVAIANYRGTQNITLATSGSFGINTKFAFRGRTIND